MGKLMPARFAFGGFPFAFRRRDIAAFAIVTEQRKDSIKINLVEAEKVLQAL
jgi:hypothetical protein